MSEIKRYDVEPLNPVGQSIDESADGLWVYFDDHAAEIARLRAEADALRVDAERWRYARSILTIAAIEDCQAEYGGCANKAEEWVSARADEAIDAAMGADA